MTNKPTIAIVAAGQMGSGVAKRLTSPPHSLTILTNLEGRSAASHRRAKEAGMEDISLSEIIQKADWVLSILPPSEAFGFARKFRDAVDSETLSSNDVRFVDCNAVNPETVKRIRDVLVEDSEGSRRKVRFIDAGIIGGPPNLKTGYDPVFYASVDEGDEDLLAAFEGLKEFGLNVKGLRGEGAGVGDASALKMSYAGMTKGIIGICTTMILAANSSSPATATALLHELHDSQPSLLQRIVTSTPSMLPKAYRWVGEMEEISSFVNTSLTPPSQPIDPNSFSSYENDEGKIHEGLARLYDRVDNSLNGQGDDSVAVLKKFVQDAEKVVRGDDQ
ncbi:6-phosphogluconate dehydrogenase C-terminal domain-like protein [Abortiporus biennis]|nr:6-phosphogluconate dehydrogenase C-terminal domain-like protein [Abortiporus biennis]